MNRALVVVEQTRQSKTLLRDAGTFATAADADLVLLGIRSESAIESDLETLERIRSVEGTPSGEDTLREAVRGYVREAAEETLADLDVVHDVVGAIADEEDEATEILSVASAEDCDHVFLAGRKRSPTGKAFFGDVTQAVLLNFDGHVTVSLE